MFKASLLMLVALLKHRLFQHIYDLSQTWSSCGINKHGHLSWVLHTSLMTQINEKSALDLSGILKIAIHEKCHAQLDSNALLLQGSFIINGTCSTIWCQDAVRKMNEQTGLILSRRVLIRFAQTKMSTLNIKNWAVLVGPDCFLAQYRKRPDLFELLNWSLLQLLL